MKLEQSFEVDAPLERVWEALVDVERVAPCLPGAAVTGRNDDGTYNGAFTIKIGPTTASYTGKLEMQNVDEATHSATMHAQGSDKRGQGGATATIVSRLSPANGGTRVQVVTDYHITGRLARFGRGGMIEDISERLLREFAGRLQSSLAGGGSPAGAGAGTLAGGGSPAGAGAGTLASGGGSPSGAGAGAGTSAGPGVATEDGPVAQDEVPTAVHPVVPAPAQESAAESGLFTPGGAAGTREPDGPPPPAEVAAVAGAPAGEPTGLPEPPGASEGPGPAGAREPAEPAAVTEPVEPAAGAIESTEPAAASEPPPPSEPAPAPEADLAAAGAPVPPAPEPAAAGGPAPEPMEPAGASVAEPAEPVAPPPPPPPPPTAAPPPPPPPAAAAPPPPPPPPATAAPPPSPPRTPPPASDPLEAGSLVGSVLVDRVKRNPKPLVAVAGGLLLLRMLRRRR